MIENRPNLNAVFQWAQRYPRVRALSLGVLSGLLLVLSFPFFDVNGFWWLAIFIPLPLMVVADVPVIRPSRAAFYAGLGTLPAWLWTHHWMWGVTKMGMPLLLVYLMLYQGLFVWIGHRMVRRFGNAWILLPIAWVGTEFLRGTVAFSGYPWYFSVHPLIDSPGQSLSRAASVGGVQMVGLFAGILVWQVRGLVLFDRSLGRLASVTGVLLLWIGIGYLGSVDKTGEERLIAVGIVQSNVPQDNRMDWTDRQRYLDWLMFRDLTLACARDPDLTPELIVWPEGFVPGWTFDPVSLKHERDTGLTWSMIPRYIGDAPGLIGMPDTIPATTVADELLVMQGALDIPMVVGSVAFENLRINRDTEDWVNYTNDGMFNSVFVVEDGVVDPVWYDKMHLTPFGEVMPVISKWEWLEQRLLGLGANGMQFVLSPGETPTVLEVNVDGGVVRLGAPVCFEATVSGVCRSLVYEGGKRRADVLMNLTNDGWFWDWDPSRRSHLLIARWRCAELNTPMVRCANTGLSCLIDREGRVIQEELSRVDSEDQIRGYLNAEFEIGGGATIYGRFGDLIGWVLSAILGLGLVLAMGEKKERTERAGR